MSRYRKVITGEKELPEISGTKFVIFPTIETRMELLEHIKATQIIEEIDEKDEKGRITSTKKIRGKHFEVPKIARTCAKLIWEGCFEHDSDGNRLKIKDDEKDTTEQQIAALVLESDIMSIFLESLTALEVVDKSKAQEIKNSQAQAVKN